MMKKGLYIFSTLIILLSAATLTFPINARAKNPISYEKAEEIVKKKVKNAVLAELELDTDDGVKQCEATLYKNNKTYEVSVNASNGKIIKYEWEKESTSWKKQHKKNIGKKRAKKIALKKVSDAKIKSVKLTSDDGIAIYKVKLKKGKKNYSLEIDAKTGRMLQYKWKAKVEKKTSESKYIGKSAAKKIALKEVPGATVVKTEFDYDDGIAVYEIELIKDSIEYEITIHAVKGDILEFEID